MRAVLGPELPMKVGADGSTRRLEFGHVLAEDFHREQRG
jgi:hypothetical protein